MFLKNIKLSNFRNYDKLELNLSKGLNIIYGNNGQGKTNLIESIYFLGMTKSHRSYIDNNLIKENTNSFKINGSLYIDNIKNNLEIYYDGTNKRMKIDNKVISKINKYVSTMNIIIFFPDDLNLIKGTPFERRRFINSEISQLSGDYISILNDYNKLLKMRNDYLKKDYIDDNYLNSITEYLIDKATIIYIMRNRFILKLNEQVPYIYKELSNIENFNIQYKTSFKIDSYDKESLKKQLSEEYKKSLKKDKKNKITTIGPHRDELEFLINEDNIKNIGSQGQQRMAVLAIKLAEINIIKEYKKTYPILLLDDVFSELDKKKKNNLLNYLLDDIQTIITTTDLNNVSKKIRDRAKLFEIKDARINKIKEVN